jgi:hypothetical protein
MEEGFTVKRRNGPGLPEELANGTSAGGTSAAATSARITVALIARAFADLRRTVERTKLSQTDVVNRAVSLYEFVDSELSAGAELVIRRPGGEQYSVMLL